jgi:formylglycine-generating enzyme required for sulfatase activity
MLPERACDTGKLPADLGPNPYRGLSAFDVEDAELFFGRSVHIDRVMGRLTELIGRSGKGKCRIVAVLGPSGNGKSSVVRAGVVAHLRETNSLGGMAINVSIMTPESRPVESLASHLARLVTSDSLPIAKSEEFLGSLRRQGDGGAYEGLRRIADMFVAATGKRLILVIDQFEEAYTLCQDESQRQAFIENLLDACRDSSGSLTVLLTLRSDFLAETQKHGEFDSIIAEHGILIPAMSEAELREAITEPARQSGYTYESGVVDLLVYETLDREGALPLLEFALTRIWEGLLAGQSPTETLRQVGGVGGSLASVAEQIHGHLTPEEAGIARRLFIALVQLGEGTHDTRRRVVLSQVLGHADDPARVREVIRRFSEPGARLITVSTSDDASREEVIELTHEALIQHWQRLRDWLEEGRDRIRFLRRLDEAVSHWEEERCPAGLLWRSPDLDLLERFEKSFPDELLARHIRFLRACTRQRRRERLTRMAVVASVMVALAAAGYFVYHERHASVTQERKSRGDRILSDLKKAPIGELPGILKQLADNYDLLGDRLRDALHDPSADPSLRLRFSLALLPIDASQADYLRDYLNTASAEETDIIRQRLAPHKQQVVADLWHALETADDDRVLPIAGALAGLDQDNPRWHNCAGKVAKSLVSTTPASFGSWLNKLSPARAWLLVPLVEIFRNSDTQYSPKEVSLAVDVLADYAVQDVDVLVDLLLGATPEQFKVLLPRVRTYEKQARELLDKELNRTLTYAWHDPPLNPAWHDSDDLTRGVIERAFGCVTDRYAFCQTLPLTEFDEVNQSLQRIGYRPVRFRPFNVDDVVQVAVVWVRDGCEACVVHGSSVSEILADDMKNRGRGYYASDVAGYRVPAADAMAERYAGVWVSEKRADRPTWIYVGAGPSDDAHYRADSGLGDAGFGVRDTLQVFLGATGEPLYSGVRARGSQVSSWWWKMSARLLEQRNEEYSGLAMEDIQCWETRLIDREATVRNLMSSGDTLAAFYLLDTREALERVSSALERWPSDTRSRFLRTVLHTRLGQRDKAEEDLAVCKREAENDPVMLQIASAYLDKNLNAAQQLLLDSGSLSPRQTYQLAGIYVWAANVFRDWDEGLAESFSNRAIDLLQRVYLEFQNAIETDAHLYPLLKHPRFVRLLKSNWDDRRYAGVWSHSADYETRCVWGVSPAELREQCRELADDGFRPRVVSVGTVGDGQRLHAAAVWYRPLVPVEQRVTLAMRQANAAVALAELGREDAVWQALSREADANLRSWVMQKINDLNISHLRIYSELKNVLHENESARKCQALILALGGCADIPAEIRDSYAETLKSVFHTHPDPGVHSSAKWVLRRWDEDESIQELERDLAQRDAPRAGVAEGTASPAGPDWYVSSQGPTFAILRPDAPFRMGSPRNEPGHEALENLHYREIGYPFAISVTPITLEEFRHFRQSHGDWNADPNSPVVHVNWFAAAEYCNWLSGKSGIPRVEWAYVPSEKDGYAEGMERAPDHMARSGYRLPTEAEWEFACRAGMSTAYCFGDATALLSSYGTFAGRSPGPTAVGLFKPNDCGLFDVHGNVWEWCDEVRYDYPAGTQKSPATRSADTFRAISNGIALTVRGGAYNAREVQLRCAYRGKCYFPTTRLEDLGFRVVRTYLPPTLRPRPVDHIVQLLERDQDRDEAVAALRDLLQDSIQQEVFEQLIERVENQALFEGVIRDLYVEPTATSDTHITLDQILEQPVLRQSRLAEAVAAISAPHPVRVAIVGDGVARYLPIFGGRVKVSDFEYARARKRQFPFGAGHDTGVAALIAAIVRGGEIFSASVGLAGKVDHADLVKAIDEAIRLKARVIVTSYGGDSPDLRQQETIERACEEGALVFAPAGNNNSTTSFWPASHPGVNSVGAVALSGNRAAYSNYGPNVDFGAPGGEPDGEQIMTIDQNGKCLFESGTSYSTPIAAAVAALILSANPHLTAEEVKMVLRETAIKGDGSFEYGCVDALAAVQMALQLRKDQNN